jgi:hemerythrin-like domain-containing protein
MQALRIIYEEHRSLAAVLHGMLYLAHEIRDRRGKPNFELLGAMIYYIDAFPERFHHPKEDEYLFRLLRLRHPDAAPLLNRLEAEHRAGAEKIRTLEQAWRATSRAETASSPTSWRRWRREPSMTLCSPAS